MKTTTSILFVLLLLLGFLNGTVLHAQEDSPPVKKLKSLYNNDTSFQATVTAMFKNLKDLPDGTKNPWRGKTIEDLYKFLNSWFYFLPNSRNGLDKIMEFSMLYYHNPQGLAFVLEEPGLSWTHYFVEERGKYMDSPASAKGVQQWLSDASVNHKDFVVPVQGFSSFNAFFTRALKPGARPVDALEDDAVLVSPADGIVNMINNNLQLHTPIPTKGEMTLHLNALLGESKFATRFIGGTALALFLMPDNYHHYHAPISGLIVESKEEVGIRLFGMPDIPDMINKGNPGYNKDYSVFEHFRHGYFVIKTQDYGYVAMIPIGLQTVGSVIFEEPFKDITQKKARKVYKGEKLGHFAYGGSTILLLFEKHRFNALSVQQGQRIGRMR